MKTDLTLVLLTHERSAFMDRALSYYDCFGYQILVADSSKQSAAERMGKYSNVAYCHLPDTSFLEKIKNVVQRVETPLMVFMSDDDFVLLPGLESSAAFLMKHDEYVVCHGYCMMYLPDAKRVHYFYRDKKVCEDYNSDDPRERLSSYLDEYLPPFYAVVRTETMRDWYALVPDKTGLEYQEVGHVFYLLYAGKARILPIPYIVRESNYIESDHGTDMYRALVSTDPAFVQMRLDFIRFASGLLASMDGGTVLEARRFVEDCLSIAANCLATGRSLTLQEIFSSEWAALAKAPVWSFRQTQFVEMPFYSSEFFRYLEGIDFLLRTTPIGKLQKQQLESTLEDVEVVLAEARESSPQTNWRERLNKLDSAFKKYPFHPEVTFALRDLMALEAPDHQHFEACDQWARRIEQAGYLAARPVPAEKVITSPFSRIHKNPAADIEAWLSARVLSAVQQQHIEDRLGTAQGGPQFVIAVDGRGAKSETIQLTLDSLGSQTHSLLNIRVLLFLETDQPALVLDSRMSAIVTSRAEFVPMLNEQIRSEAAQWVLIVQAGEELTEHGLLIVALELLDINGVNAVSADEIWRLADGELGGAFRPAFNLDYIQSFPAAMARHWLFRSDVVAEMGGFDSAQSSSFELDMLLRLVERNGLAGLGHVSEALMLADAPALADIPNEQQIILASLRRRGYSAARIESVRPGRYQVMYGHDLQPTVSIVIAAGENLPKLQRCLEGILESTDYSRYEILLVKSSPDCNEVGDWLVAIEGMGESKLRLVRPDPEANVALQLNLAASLAVGEQLLFLSPDTAVLEPDWLAKLLNHALRPEVGIVGSKMLSPDGRVAQAGLILGLEGPVGGAFVGELLDSPGYMQRLQVDQNLSAVSLDSLMIATPLFVELGGFNPSGIATQYLSTDLCLRSGEAGYLTVWAAGCQLMLDRGPIPAPLEAERDVMYQKWLDRLARDPSYNSNLSLAKPGGFKLADPQISWRPLESWRPMPVVLAHPADLFGCGHYRVIQPLNALREAGLVDGALSVGLMHVTDLERYNPDVVMLQRQIGEERLQAMQRMKSLSPAFKVYELDDYLPNLPLKSVHRKQMPKDIAKSLRKGLSLVDRFVVSTEALGEALGDMHPDIRVMKNRLDPRWWGDLPKSSRRTSAKPRVGWAGGASHTGDLEMIVDVVKALADEVEWVFFGMCPEKLRPYVHEYHLGVPIEQYPAALARLNLDLALAPVEHNLFNECKSNLRLLEYGICGFPVICTDIRCYEGDLPVTRVRNRYKDWVDAIRMHLADLDASAQMGDVLKSQVQRDWMLAGDNLELWRKAWLPD